MEGKLIFELPLVLMWFLYMIFEALRESYYWHFKNTSYSKNNDEIHPIFLAQRFIVFTIISVVVMFMNEIGYRVLLTVILCSPGLHNSFYYYFRNELDGSYPKGFLDQSKTSTAISTKFFTPIVRIGLFVIGLILFFV